MSPFADLPRRVRPSRWLGLTAGLWLACTGSIQDPSVGGVGSASNESSGGGGTGSFTSGGGGGGPGISNAPLPPGTPAATFACTKGASSQQVPLRRLSHAQLVNTVNDLVTRMAGASATAILTTVAPAIANLPADVYVGARNKGRDGFQRADQQVSQFHADGQFALANALGAALTDTVAKRQALFGACATDSDTSNDAACVGTFIKTWGPRILRTPVSTDDVTFYSQAMRGTTASQAALADVVALLFASPRLFYLVEDDSPDQVLPPYELAARLSYQLWDAPPDDDLLAAAASGALATTAGYSTQVDRLIASPRADAVLQQFFSQWFTMPQAANLTTDLQFKDYAALVGTDKPTVQSTQGMQDDVLGSVLAIAQESRPLADLLTDRRVFTKDPYVAKVYGVSPWDGTSKPVEPSSTARVGLITRPAFVASGSYSTHPILKGSRLRLQVLCDVLGDPPPNAMAIADATQLPSGLLSERQEIELQTAPSTCSACHSVMNPLGFATENFDSLGRERQQAKVYTSDGTLSGSVAINTSVVPRVILSDATTKVDGAAGLTQAIASSKTVEACFAAQYFRFSFNKAKEDGDQDGCSLAPVEDAARHGASLHDLMRTMLLTNDFTHRRVD